MPDSHLRQQDRTRARPGRVPTPAPLAGRLVAGLARPGQPLPPVLDPACGDGSLLLAALEARDGDPAYARGQLFGIELDPRLAEACRERLRRAAGLPRGTRLDEHIVCADALSPDLAWPAGTAVVANPPWLSFSGRASAGPRGARLRDRFVGCSGWPSLHSAFVERVALHVAREGTRARLLVPSSVTSLAGYAPLRRRVTELVALDGRVELLGEDAFEGVTEPAALVGLAPRAAGPGASEAGWIATSPDGARLIELLRDRPRLPARTFADPGVHSGNCGRELVRRDEPARGPWLREGRCLQAFRLDRAQAWLDLSLERGSAAPDGRPRRFRVADEAHHRSFPVLLRQTAERPIAALHEPPGRFRNSLLAARAVPGLDAAFVVAVLNAPLAAAWHRLSFLDARQRVFPQVKVAHLASQPFPIARREDDPALHDEVARAVRALDPHSAGFEAACAALRARVLDAFELAPADRALVLRAAATRAAGRRSGP